MLTILIFGLPAAILMTVLVDLLTTLDRIRLERKAREFRAARPARLGVKAETTAERYARLHVEARAEIARNNAEIAAIHARLAAR